MKRSSLFIFTIIAVILFTSSFYSSGTIQDPSSPSIGLDSHTIISNTTSWDGMTANLQFNQTIIVQSGGVLQITNSILNITNISNLTQSEVVIQVLEGGILEIHNSHVSFNGTSHGISAGTAGSSSSGYVSLINSTLSALGGDILHIEGDVDLTLDTVIFEDGTSDGLDIVDLRRDLTITDSIFRNNQDDGIVISMNGNYLLKFQNVTTEYNGDEGLAISNENTDIELHNVNISWNGDKGAEVSSSNGHILVNLSSVVGNFDDGFQFEGSNNATVISSNFDNNGFGNPQGKHGLQVDNTLHLHVFDSSFENNTADGLNLAGANVEIKGIVVRNTGDEGIQYDGSFSERSISIDGIIIDGALNGDGIKFRSVLGSIFISNSIISGGDDGIQVETGATQLFVDNVIVENNRESGIEIEDVGNFSITDSKIRGNDVNGIEISNTQNAVLQNLEVLGNEISGIEVVRSNVNIVGVISALNSGLPSGSNGINIQGSNYTIFSSAFQSNTGNGITIVSSNGTISQVDSSKNGNNGLVVDNSITVVDSSDFDSNGENGMQSTNSSLVIEFSQFRDNSNNGLNLLTKTTFEIRNNTITNNEFDGIFVGNSSIGIIHYNTFGGNLRYAIEVAPRDDGLVIDARFNYFGSDEGPIWESTGIDGRDGVIGPINTSLILTSDGEVTEFTPPVIENEFLGYTIEEIILFVVILTIIVAIVSLFVGSYYYQIWKENTQPRTVLMISPSGLPIVEYHFQTSKADGALISGFLSAISSFGAEVVDQSTEGFRIREIAYDNFTILLDKIHTSMLAVVVNSSNWLVKRRVKQLALAIFNKYPELEPEPSSLFNVNHLEEFDKLVEDHLKEFLDFEGND